MPQHSAFQPFCVYVSAAGSGDIHVLRGNAGNPDLVSVQQLTLGGAIMPMALRTDSRRLYAVDRKEPFGVYTLAIDADSGTLTRLVHSMLAGNMAYVSTSLDGRWLLTASYGEDRIAVNAIDDDGAVGATLQVLPTSRHAHAICPAPDGQHIWVSCLGGDELLCYRIDASPETPLQPLFRWPCKPGSGPRHLVFHPNRRWLYVIHELDGCVSVLELGENGAAPTCIAHARFLPAAVSVAPWSAEIRISSDGHWLFASDRRAAVISALRIDNATGALEFVDYLHTEALPRSFALAPDNCTLFIASQETGNLSVVAFDANTGRMQLHDRLACGASPTWVEVAPLN